MKAMKKFVALTAAAAMMAGLAACGSSSATTSATAAPAAAETEAATETAAAEAAETEAAAATSDTDYPAETITILVGFSAGSGTDLGARLLAEPLSKELGVPVVVENLPGSGSWIVWNQLIKDTPADGYTLAAINHNFAIGKYDPDTPREFGLDDVQLLASQAIDPNLMAIRADETRFTDFDSFVEYARENPVFAATQTVGITDGDATMCQYLRKYYDCQIELVPVDSASDGRTMFLAGDVDVYFASVGDVYTYVQDGTMNAVVLFNDIHTPFLPDVPTVYELGYENAISAYSARGYCCPKGTDPAIVEKLVNAITKCFEDPEYQKQLEALGVQSYVTTGDEFRELLESQLDNRLNIWDVQP